MKNRIKIITFSGVDGAGKTTILREFTEILQYKYNQKVKELRHRPTLLPILSAIKYGEKQAELKTMEVLPRTGVNNSKISSYIRFFYYLIDYVFGQWVIYFKYTRKSIIVIYDRYYFDFINDARRTNIDLDSRLIKFFYYFVFKPEINIFLYASPEIILTRKQEMDEESIKELTSKYQNLFNSFAKEKKGEYKCIENIHMEKTLRTIENLYNTTI
jgi:thymidylate kinase